MEPQSKQRVFTGVVTQLQDNFGVVDQEVHFTTSDVIGRIPQLGEKVLVKAVRDPSVSVSWTAQRVQSLNSQQFKSPPPLLPPMTPSQKPGILGNKPQPLLKSPKIPPLIPSMQQNTAKPGLLQTPPHVQPPWGCQFDTWGGGNRKRHSEGMGSWRGGRWEDSGPWSGDGVHHKRRRWKGSSEEGQKKSGSPPPQSCLLFSRFPRDSLACNSLEMLRRYPHIPIPENFLHLQLSWTESFPPDQPLNLSGTCSFYVGPAQSVSETTATPRPGSAYAAKVMLLSIPAVEELYQRCCGLSQGQQEPQGGAVHPTTLIKLLVAGKGPELQLPGGYWCPKEDGSNPAKDPHVLIRTAVRCVREQTGLDLGHCSHWYKMAEVLYLCGGEVEKVVIYLPDVWRTVPTAEEWAELRAGAKKEQEDDGTLPFPEDPSLLVHPCPGDSLCSLPLSSLLEPRNSQSQDAFEASLSAELFSEMLQRDFGLQIYRSLCSLYPDSAPLFPRPVAEEKEERSTPTGDEGKKGSRDSRGSGAKDGKRKSRRDRGNMEEVKEDEKKKENKEKDDILADIKDGDSESTLDEGKVLSIISDTSDSTSSSIISDRPAGWCPVLPRSVLLSWVFFDRKLIGSLRGQDLQDILLSLGLHLTLMQARELVCRAVVGELCQYRRLAGRWEDTEQTEPDSNLQGNRPLIASSTPKGGGSSRRSGGSSGGDVVTHRGTTVNITNLLRSLEKGESLRQRLEHRINGLQARLAEVESEAQSLQSKYRELAATKEGQDDLRERLEKAERLNSSYEKSLKENAGHMIAVIEKMQKLVDKTTSLAEARTDGAEKA